MDDRKIVNTFNAFYQIKFGKNANDIDYRIFRTLCRHEKNARLKEIMFAAMDVAKKYINLDNYNDEVWVAMNEDFNSLCEQYRYDRACMQICIDIVYYIDERERKKRWMNGE